MVRFGAFELDAQARRVRREGADVHLSPKAFDLLALLLDAAPRVLPKRELHDRLWPGGMVTDSTLVALVKQLRAALSDHDRKSPLIRTVHRVGYALECPSASRQSASAGATARWLVAGQRKAAARCRREHRGSRCGGARPAQRPGRVATSRAHSGERRRGHGWKICTARTAPLSRVREDRLDRCAAAGWRPGEVRHPAGDLPRIGGRNADAHASGHRVTFPAVGLAG